MVSLVAHVIIVGGAMAASVPPPPRAPVARPDLVYRPPRVVDLPRSTTAHGPAPEAPGVPRSDLIAITQIQVPDVLPAISTLTPTTASAPTFDFAVIRRTGGRPGGVEGGASDTLSRPRTEHEVDRPVQLRGGQQGPRYPELLRAAGVEGQVTMQFVVDTLGIADRSSFVVVDQGHALFAVAVRDALARQRFVPAEAGGRRVRQLVVQTFLFNIHR